MKFKPAIPFSAEKFYDVTSEFYEQMIDFEKNLNLRIAAYKNIFPGNGTAADLGCGIGLDSIALAKNGHTVTAFDVSPKMISTARLIAKRYNTEINFKVNSIISIPKSYREKFDSVVCVGNTIAHLNNKDLHKALIQMHGLLKHGGKLFLHILNYQKILAENKRVNNIANRGGKTIIRFYDFLGEHIMFNILTFETANPKQYQLISTKHFSHLQKEILAALRETGFTRLKSYGNWGQHEFVVSESKDLFVEAAKS